VENKRHWRQDVWQNEDRGRVRCGAGATILSLLRGITLSLRRHAGLDSPAAARSRLTNRVPPMLPLLRT